MSQIALPLDLRGRSDPESIVIGNANRAVYEALMDPAAWPFRTAVLTGPHRSGKSLIGKWASGQGVTVIDDAEREDEIDLFHRWNAAQESSEPLLLISNCQPWDISLPDLRSRLGGSLQLEIGTPDDDMVAQLIEAMAAQRGLALSEGATAYLVPRIERSFSGIERLLEVIDRLSLERKTPATMSVWRDALDQIQGPEQQRLL